MSLHQQWLFEEMVDLGKETADTAKLMQIHETLIAERNWERIKKGTLCDKPDHHCHNIDATSSGVLNSPR